MSSSGVTRRPCTGGICRQADSGRCMCIPCPNSEVCDTKAFPGMAGQLCSMCRTLVCKRFATVDVSQPEACIVCMDQCTRFVEHPSGCGHRACVKCMREMWFPEAPPPTFMVHYGIEIECGCAECREVLSDGLQWPCEAGWSRLFPNDSRWPCGAEWSRMEKVYPSQLFGMLHDIIRKDDEYYHGLDQRANPHNCFICRRHHHVPGLCDNEDCPLH